MRRLLRPPYRGFGLALLLSAGAVAAQYRLHPLPHYDEHELPDFDAWVYLAMAREPAVFTVAPWGYRLLRPALIHALAAPGRGGPRGLFRIDRALTIAGFAMAGGLLFRFLRRLGHGEWAALAAVGAFGLSRPIVDVIQEPLLTDSLTLPLVIAVVLAVEAGAGDWVLALLMLLGTLSKEMFVVFIPLLGVARWQSGGPRAALRAVLVTGVPVVLLGAVLRQFWTPHLRPPHVALDLEVATVTLRGLVLGWGTRPWTFALGGLLPLAALGALRRAARPYLWRYGYLAAGMSVLPFTSWINAPQVEPGPLYTARHMVYALPFVLPLALFALDRVWPHRQPPPEAWGGWRRIEAPAALLVAASLALPLLTLDRYRRAPLHETRFGPRVATLCRESLRVARDLEAGREVDWGVDAMGFVWHRSDPAEMDRMRWFLEDGWGDHPFDRRGEVRMRGTAASFLLPSFAGSDLELVLSLGAPALAPVAVEVNGRPLRVVGIGPGPDELRAVVPRPLLYRGDNRVTLRRAAGPGLRLRAVTIRPVASRSSAAPRRESSGV